MTSPEAAGLAAARPPRVTVVIPFLNAAPFIEETVDSVLAQTFRSWELLLVDDGSTDGSSELARQAAERHPDRIRRLEHPGHANRGASATRNLGFRHARGDYLAMLDADDVWLPNKLADQVAILDRHPELGMVYGNTLYWHSWRGRDYRAGGDRTPWLGAPLDEVIQPPRLLTLFLTHEAVVPCTCSVLARRSVVERVGGFEESFPRLFDDQAFYAKMLLAAPVYVSGEVWDKYRIHGDSMCAHANTTAELRDSRRRYMRWLAQYGRTAGVRDAALRHALFVERWRSYYPSLGDEVVRWRQRLTRLGSRARKTTAAPIRELFRRGS